MLVNPDVYPPRARQGTQSLLTAMLGGQGFMEAVQVLMTDFHPSFFLELDWQELRLDQDYSQGPGQFEAIDDFVFAATLPTNIWLRTRTDNVQEAAFSRWVDSYYGFFERWKSRWPLEYRATMPELAHEVSLGLSSAGLPEQPVLEIDSDAIVSDALTSLRSRERVFSSIRVTLSNALFSYLDYPATRTDAKRFLRQDRQEGGGLPFLHAMPGPEDASAADLEVFLRARASSAASAGLELWASAVERVADRLRDSQLDDIQDFDGNWSDGCLPCGRCSMWFAYEHIVAIDTRCSFMNWRNTNLTYLPREANQADCFFCGHSAPVESAAMFYSPERRQVVYCLPINVPRIAETEAIEFFKGGIQYLRAQYTKKISFEEIRRFDDATELLTYSLPDFLYAMQMGETVPEDHVYNVVRLSNGSGLLADMSKGFARGVTASELEWLTTEGRVTFGGDESARQPMPQEGLTATEKWPTMTEEDVLEAMITGLVDWISERPEERAKGWVPKRPSAER